MRCLCVDPGSKSSAIVVVEVTTGVAHAPWGVLPVESYDLPNQEAIALVSEMAAEAEESVEDLRLAIEVMRAIYVNVPEPKPTPKPTPRRGKPKRIVIAAGGDQLETERWGGRIQGAFASNLPGGLVLEVWRATAKTATIGKAVGTDADVKNALVQLYGGSETAFGQKCSHCKGKGWVGRGRPVCEVCGGNGWTHPPGPLTSDGVPWKGSHKYAALAVGVAAFKLGGDWWQSWL